MKLFTRTSACATLSAITLLMVGCGDSSTKKAEKDPIKDAATADATTTDAGIPVPACTTFATEHLKLINAKTEATVVHKE